MWASSVHRIFETHSCAVPIGSSFILWGSILSCDLYHVLSYTTTCLPILFIVDYLGCYQVVVVMDKTTMNIHSYKSFFMHATFWRPDSDTEYPMLCYCLNFSPSRWYLICSSKLEIKCFISTCLFEVGHFIPFSPFHVYFFAVVLYLWYLMFNTVVIWEQKHSKHERFWCITQYFVLLNRAVTWEKICCWEESVTFLKESWENDVICQSNLFLKSSQKLYFPSLTLLIFETSYLWYEKLHLLLLHSTFFFLFSSDVFMRCF